METQDNYFALPASLTLNYSNFGVLYSDNLTPMLNFNSTKTTCEDSTC